MDGWYQSDIATRTVGIIQTHIHMNMGEYEYILIYRLLRSEMNGSNGIMMESLGVMSI